MYVRLDAVDAGTRRNRRIKPRFDNFAQLTPKPQPPDRSTSTQLRIADRHSGTSRRTMLQTTASNGAPRSGSRDRSASTYVAASGSRSIARLSIALAGSTATTEAPCPCRIRLK